MTLPAAGNRELVVGIDASRNRSGGARVHLVGMLGAVDPQQFGIREVHVWSYPSLLSAIPDVPWLVKHAPAELSGSLGRQLWWQRRRFPAELIEAGCNALLTTDAGSVCRSRPSVVMSRDMLSFEPGEMQRYGWSVSRLRLELLKWVQVDALRSASGALFLTQYAADTIQRYSGRLPTVRIIPHAVGDRFRRLGGLRRWPGTDETVRCVYVSNADLYKHQWHVVDALARLRARGFPVSLTLVGGGAGPAADLLDQALRAHDPGGVFVTRLPAVPHDALPGLLNDVDLFIFASSCENMPNTLLEGMASALPIACSDRGPMPEVLRDGGTYFDPENPAAIASAVEQILVDPSLRARIAARAGELARAYTWRRTAAETWTFLVNVAERANGPGAR